jgi:4-aminobutyrate aminotransferase-like enzyme
VITLTPPLTIPDELLASAGEALREALADSC